MKRSLAEYFAKLAKKHPPSRLTLRKLFAIMVAWALAFAWPSWFSDRNDLVNPQRPWLENVLNYSAAALPVGLPLTLIAVTGWWIINWQLFGLSAAWLVAFLYLRTEFMRRSEIDYVPLAIWIGGLGAIIGGYGRVGFQAILRSRWFTAGWCVLLATLGGCSLCMLLYIARYA